MEFVISYKQIVYCIYHLKKKGTSMVKLVFEIHSSNTQLALIHVRTKSKKILELNFVKLFC
jgi:hypothetical protein